MNGPKRHHYLPQFYLEGFCRDGHLWVFDREANELRRQTPVNTAVMKQYYTVEDEGGEKNNDIELFLSQIESVSKPVVQKVVSKAQMSSEDKEVMSVFIAFLMNRVPDFEKSINKAESHVIQKIMDLTFSSEERAEALMKRYVNATGDQSEVSAKDLVEFHRSGAYTLEIHRNEFGY